MPLPPLPVRAATTALFAASAVAVASFGGSFGGGPSASSSRALLDRIWQGVRQAEQRHQSGCGMLTETRTSPMLVRPLVLRGTFCAAGRDRFRVEYEGSQVTRVVYDRGVLNVSTDGGRRVEVMDVSRAVQRAQRYFSGPKASLNLERDFSITASETGDGYSLVLLPVAGRIAGRVRRVAVELRKPDLLPRRIEIEGKSGVQSVFEIRVETLDTPLDERQFEVYRPS